MKRILFLVNHDIVIYNFRKELVERLLADGNEVIISSPYGERIELLKRIGCQYIPIELDRHNLNLYAEIRLLIRYVNLLKSVKPDIVLSYTIKPNLYGSIVARICKIPIIINVTGLGSAFANVSITRMLLTSAYRFAFCNVQTVFVQNKDILEFFVNNKIGYNKLKLLPGSGVNLRHFYLIDYPKDEIIKFIFISRIMKSKGIDLYLETAKYIKNKYPNTQFLVCGFCEEQYIEILREYENCGIIKYLGFINDIRKILLYTHCTIHPTFYPEGVSNVLLESAASGRPVITTDRSGCCEVVDDGVNGYLVPEHDLKALILAVEKFLELSNEDRCEMGKAGRRKVEREFDRNIVVEEYVRQIAMLD